MRVTLPESIQSLDGKIQSRLEKCRAGILCPDTLKEQSLALRKSLGWTKDCGLIVAAGHQPVLYHPGLLMKDVLAHALAARYQGVAYNIVLDTDEVDLEFSYPGLMELDFSNTVAGTASWPVRKKTIRYGNAKRIVGSVDFTERDRNALLQACQEARKGLHLVLNPLARQRVRRSIRAFEDSIRVASSILEPSIALRKEAHRELGISIRDVKASDLFSSDAFLYFAGFVAERAAEFRRVYNRELARYRQERRIKNPAQPLPDLDDASGELPFWYIENGMREPLQEAGFAEAMESVKEGRGSIYPRAVTTSLFFRLFFCDLFIHGTGGGRYDRITEKLISEFFHCDAAPFVVTTASLSMDPRADLPVDSREPEQVLYDLREMKFDPARNLGPDCSLRQKRDDLIQNWHEAKRSGEDRSSLHDEFIKLRRKASLYMRHSRHSLSKELARARDVQRARRIYGDRSYPIFFYDNSALSAAVQEIARPTGQRAPAVRGP